MEDHAIRGPLRLENGEDVVVRVAVVDHEGLVELTGEVDVPAERALLRGVQLLARAVVVEAGLPDGTDDVVAGEHGDLRECRVEAAASPSRSTMRAASFGWTDTPTTTSGRVRAISTEWRA